MKSSRKFSHIKLDEIESTQFYLKDFLSKANDNNGKTENILVTTQRQTAGVGRRGTEWIMLENCLAFSFTYRPEFPIELTSLAIGTVLVDFFRTTNSKLGLKWPNDLYINKNKIGGIICHVLDDQIIVGVGINYGPSKISDFDFSYKASYLTDTKVLSAQDYHELPKKFYSYLLEKNLDAATIVRNWSQACCHLNKPVEFSEDGTTIKGLFVGIDESGQALIKSADTVRKFLSGHLSLIDALD